MQFRHRLTRRVMTVLGLGALASATALMGVSALPATAAGSPFANPSAIGPVQVSATTSTITVAGQSTVTDVNVTLNGVTPGLNLANKPVMSEFDIVLEGPNGAKVTLISDASSETCLAAAASTTLTFDDGAATAVPFATDVPSGTFKPTDYDAPGADCDSSGDGLVPAATATTLANAFNGSNPNGTWKLHVADDNAATPSSTIAGGWSLEINPPQTCKGLTATLIGTDGNDVLIGTAGNDVIKGNAGDDIIRGLGGNDTLCGDAGRDKLKGGAGKDYCNGGLDKDKARKCEKAKQI